MKKALLSFSLALGTLFAANAQSQCVANGTVIPTATPGEFTITDLSTVPVTGVSFFTGGDGGFLNLQPSTTTGVYQYTANGTYNYFFIVMDSINACYDTIGGTIVVTGINTGPGCQASFILLQDSLNANQYWCWNTSTPSSPAMTASYFWNFGDGSSSTMPYPTHVYNSLGAYNLCLTITFSNGCTSTFCDSLFITVKASGTTLNVLPPGTGLSLEEQSAVQDINIYPNPNEGEFQLEISSNNSSEVDVVITNLAGQRVFTDVSSLNTGNNILSFDQRELEKGVYFVTVRDRANYVEKTMRIFKR